VRLSILNAGYRSTNVWVLSSGRARLLVDLGWPGQLGALLAALRRLDVPVAEITHGFATHYHIDHAGCAEELKAHGMTLVVTPEQVEAIPAMARWTKPADRYVPITMRQTRVVTIAESRGFLDTLGLAGEFVHTPGHSHDSVSLVLDSGEAFTGDLTLPSMATETDAPIVQASWAALAARGVTTVYGGHAAPAPLARVITPHMHG
jgi:glyoxylase-like metal-dependent hydrolase (beta-lactamase superfamily II)